MTADISTTTPKPNNEFSIDDVVQYGQRQWTELKNSGVDIADGPCIDDNEAFSGWAIDLVRQSRIDYLPENRCPAFVSGKVTRMVELSLEGNVVRILPEELWKQESTINF